MTEAVRRAVGQIRARLHVWVRTARERPKVAAEAVAAYVLRWALRIAMPLGGAAAMLTLFPFRVTAAGARFRVQGSLLTRHTVSADTSFGSWIFPHVDGLPVGVHISPVNVDLVRIASAASPDPQAYAEQLRTDLVHQLPAIATWLIGELLLGTLLGLTAAAAINLALRQLRALPRREHELKHRLRQLVASAAVLAVVAVIGAVTYDPAWARQSRVTGTLATLQLFPDQLRTYYDQHAKALDVLSAIAAIQSGLQQHIEQKDVAATAFNVMFISDMHLGSTYPLVKQYAANFDVKLIVNTGDEAEFGTSAEMTTAYLSQLRAVTKIAPMVWMPGNHDSPATIAIMRSIPGVTVLGTKSSLDDGSGGYRVAGEEMSAYGLVLGAVPDPRVYGASGDFGANDGASVNPLEQRTVDASVSRVPVDALFDIFAAHEPAAAAQLVKDLPGRIRQTNSGHLHAQNADKDVQKAGSPITLVEGSTGAGGLDHLYRGVAASPIEFSIESVAANCQFTKLVRFQIVGAAPASASDIASGELPQVTASTRYLTPQDIAADRTCGTDQGITPPVDIG